MKTLVLVDVQNDFIPGGSLEVPGGDRIIEPINRIQDQFELVIATQDWHPLDHVSFASNHEGLKPFDVIEMNGMDQVLWPDHCVQGTEGAQFHPDLEMNRIEAIFRKGTSPDIDSYSGFYDNGHQKTTGLSGYLREKNAQHLYFGGLAADICVYFTMKDAMEEGFKVTLVEEAVCALIDKDYKDRKRELRELGGNIIREYTAGSLLQKK